MKKIMSLFLCIVIAITWAPMAAFAETLERGTWIMLSYPGDITIRHVSGATYTPVEDATNCVRVTEAGTITLEVKSTKENQPLEKIEVVSGIYNETLDNALGQVQYSDAGQSFSADEAGTVTVTLTVEAGTAYKLQVSFVEGFVARVVDEQNHTKQGYNDLQAAIDAVGEKESIVIDAETVMLAAPLVVDGKIVSSYNDGPVSLEAGDNFSGDSLIVVKNGALLNGGELHLDGKAKVKYGIQTVPGEYRTVMDLDNCSFKNFTDYGIVADGADVAIKYCGSDGSNGKGGVHLISGSNPGNMTLLGVIGDLFQEKSSIVYDENFSQYKPAKDWDIILCDEEPPHTEGYDVWEKGADGMFTEKKTVTPSQPSGGGGGGGGATPTTPTGKTEDITNTGATGTDVAATTVAVKTLNTAAGKETSFIDKATADQIIEHAVKNESKEIIINAETKDSKAASASVTLPSDAVQKISRQTGAGLTIQTSVTRIALDTKAVASVAEHAEGSNIELIAEKKQGADNELRVDLQIRSGGKNITAFQGGTVAVTMKLNDVLAKEAAENLVGVYIDDNGFFSKIGGTKNADQTFTFHTTHLSIYAIMNMTSADAAIAKQTSEVKKMKFQLTSKLVTTKKGRKAVKLSWNKQNGVVLDGIQVYRSMKKSSGYSKKPVFATENQERSTYTNTAVKRGQKYYYKVRGYATIDGKKVYTSYSNLAYRSVK